jgi:hypothetical protein
MPSHAAEQRSKERKSDSVIAKRHPDVARSLQAAQGSRPAVDQVIRLHFLLVRFLYASKENERSCSKYNGNLLYANLWDSPAKPGFKIYI